MILPVDNVGQFGVVTDLRPHEMPLNAWSAARNVRFRDGYLEKFKGHSEVFATPLWAPYWLLPVQSGPNFFWLYASLAKVGATDMSSHADITRASGGDYSADANIGWTGGVLGGIPVINNGVDPPQMWNTPSLATDLANLTNWPASTSCRSLRVFKQFLLALDVTKSGTRYSQMVKWSHPADPLTVPTSWDETDPTIDAGEFNLSETGDAVVDAFPLRDVMLLYKQYSTWAMQFIGGVNIFRFYKVFDSFGAFTRRTAVEFFSGQHVVFTGDDVVLHDGQRADSILKKRLRQALIGQIDTTNYQKAFLTTNYDLFEVWICFPETGSTFPTKALVWNWRDNTWGFRDLPATGFIVPGVVDPAAAGSSWDSDGASWDSDTAAWDDLTFDPSRRRLLGGIPGSTKLILLDETQQQLGVDMTSYVERTGLGFPLKKEAPPDFTTRKLLRTLWPRIEGTDGGVVSISIGSQEKVDGPVTYSSSVGYVIGQTDFVDVLVEGRLHALKFESADNIEWRLHGYDVDIVPVGMY
jgi:hypothetical protein